VYQDVATHPHVNADLARRWGVASQILVPLLARDRLGGVMMATRSRPSSWSADEVALADALAGYAAISIENARLYEEARDSLLRLEQAQHSIVRSERLAAIGTVAASLAHEVRNPLNSINLQLVQLTRRVARCDETLRAGLSSLLETARREIARLDGLVEEFLSLASVDRVSLVPSDPDAVVRESLALMGPLARERGIEVREELEGAPRPIVIDGAKIKQVLVNLIRNAIEAMPGGGVLTVATQGAPGSFVIRVADTGVGIEPDLDVFDLFLTTKKSGTGLGLAIARRIVEAHGGTLSYESEPGKGTTFSIVLKS